MLTGTHTGTGKLIPHLFWFFFFFKGWNKLDIWIFELYIFTYSKNIPTTWQIIISINKYILVVLLSWGTETTEIILMRKQDKRTHGVFVEMFAFLKYSSLRKSTCVSKWFWKHLTFSSIQFVWWIQPWSWFLGYNQIITMFSEILDSVWTTEMRPIFR